MSRFIPKSAISELALTLRMEALIACEEAHSMTDSSEPRKSAAMRERAAVKKSLAERLELLVAEPEKEST